MATSEAFIRVPALTASDKAALRDAAMLILMKTKFKMQWPSAPPPDDPFTIIKLHTDHIGTIPEDAVLIAEAAIRMILEDSRRLVGGLLVYLQVFLA